VREDARALQPFESCTRHVVPYVPTKTDLWGRGRARVRAVTSPLENLQLGLASTLLRNGCGHLAPMLKELGVVTVEDIVLLERVRSPLMLCFKTNFCPLS
jgi:hypothetical protein